MKRYSHLTGITAAERSFAVFPGHSQCRHQDRHQDRDNGNDHKQFNECKAFFRSHHFCTSIWAKIDSFNNNRKKAAL